MILDVIHTEWTQRTGCHICNQIGHLGFECPPKYKNAIIRTSSPNKIPPPHKNSPTQTFTAKRASTSKPSSPSPSPSEPHFAGTANVHFAHAALLAHNTTKGTILYKSLIKTQRLALTLIYNLLKLTIALIHSFIFFTLCRIYPPAQQNSRKHLREQASTSMILDVIHTYFLLGSAFNKCFY